MSAVITFNVAEFRAMYPQFPDNEQYSDANLESYFETATCYISPANYGWLAGACRKKALYMMVAHLAALSAMIMAGNTPTLVQSSTIDKISVTLVPPPTPNQFSWWLQTTPYGMQLYALLQAKSVGGWYVGGLPETAAFRKVGGIL